MNDAVQNSQLPIVDFRLILMVGSAFRVQGSAAPVLNPELRTPTVASRPIRLPNRQSAIGNRQFRHSSLVIAHSPRALVAPSLHRFVASQPIRLFNQQSAIGNRQCRNSPFVIRHSSFSRAILLLCLLLAAGCRDRAPDTELDVVRMQLGDRTFTLEVADTEPVRNYGLMRRDSLPRHHGMIFVFPDERPRGFWMKNVRFPLDIIFLDAGRRVVSIHRMEAYDTSATRSEGPAKYAIEINAGMAAEAGVRVGDELDIPPRAREPGGIQAD